MVRWWVHAGTTPIAPIRECRPRSAQERRGGKRSTGRKRYFIISGLRARAAAISAGIGNSLVRFTLLIVQSWSLRRRGTIATPPAWHIAAKACRVHRRDRQTDVEAHSGISAPVHRRNGATCHRPGTVGTAAWDAAATRRCVGVQCVSRRLDTTARWCGGRGGVPRGVESPRRPPR
jgi:hypothetical protein